MKRSIFSGTLALSVMLLAAGCSSNSSPSNSTNSSFKGTAMTGAGATFPAPVYTQWFKSFLSVESGAKINYQAIGSGGGIQQFTSKTVDFGASDAPLKDAEASALSRPAFMFPTVLGGDVVAYNLPGVTAHLKLDGPTVANIFLGKITKWNDPAITSQNPGVSLPATAIQVVHRADESGTTFVFTSWLSQESSDWMSKVGAGKGVQWPVGTGGNGNSGVAAGIKQTQGAVGYVEYQYAVSSGLGFADIKGKSSSDYVSPSVDSISKAAGSLQLPITSSTNILDSTAAGAYPIASTTYLLIYKDLTPLGKDKAQTIYDFVYWALTKGQQEVSGLNYAPLPSTVAQQDLQQLTQLTYNGQGIQPSPSVK